MTRARLFPALCAVVLAQPACAQDRRANSGWPDADSVVSIAATQVGIHVSAWRDFMPQVDGDGSGSALMVSVQLTSLNSAPLPPGLTVDSAWVRSPDGVWATAPSDEQRPEVSNALDLMLRGGPKWPTDQLIDVLVRLRLKQHERYHLLARQQPIGKTQ